MSSLVRSCRQHGSYINRDDIAFAFSSGFIAFGSIAVLLNRSPDSTNSSWYYLGLSAFIGLLGKEQDMIMRAVLTNSFGAVKVLLNFDKLNEDQDKEKKDDP